MAVLHLASADRDLIAWLHDQQFGSLRVLDVQGVREPDSAGHPALMLTVTLPLEGETRDAEDLVDPQLAGRERALSLDVPWPWYVKIRPNVEEEQEEDHQPEPSGD